jgi:hypothetical protein
MRQKSIYRDTIADISQGFTPMDPHAIRRARAQREALKQQYRDLFEAVSSALREADPISLIAMGCPSDEYEPEVGTILPRLREAQNANDVQRILHEEFVKWFGEDNAGPLEIYHSASIAVWHAWDRFGHSMK